MLVLPISLIEKSGSPTAMRCPSLDRLIEDPSIDWPNSVQEYRGKVGDTVGVPVGATVVGAPVVGAPAGKAVVAPVVVPVGKAVGICVGAPVVGVPVGVPMGAPVG